MSRAAIMGNLSIKVMIVDDHPLFREGIRNALSTASDINTVAVKESGEEALRAIPQVAPDIILLDINLPGINGLQVARQIKSEFNHIGVIILTAHHDTEQVIHVMRTGAAAYCPKDVDATTLINTIREVSRGYYVVDGQNMTQRQLQGWLEEKIESSTGPYTIDAEGHYIPLSPREMEILEYVTQGLINKEIAKKLGISQQTVKNHMTSILKKLNVKDRTQAAVVALRRGWVRIDDAEEL
jgi:DNA-binding NarL/FixJ family response regulator